MEWVRIGDIGKIITGNTPSKKNPEFYKTKDIPFIGPSDIKNFREVNHLYESEKFISHIARSKARIVPKNSILVTCIGNIGKVGKVEIKEIAFNQQINAIIVEEQDYDVDYLLYALIFNQKRLESISNAPVVPIINKTAFADFKIKIDKSIKNQKYISKCLNFISKLIILKKEQIQAYDDLIESLFYEMFNCLEIKELPLKRFIAFSKNSVSDFSEYLDENYIGVENIEKETGRILKVEKVSDSNIKSSKNYFTNDDILYSRIRPNLNKVAIPDFNGLVSSEVFVINCNDKINKYFLAYTLRSNRFVSYAILNSSGANFPRVNKKIIEGYKIKVPPIELQNKFADYVIKIEEEKKKLNSSLKELENLFDAFMQEAFSGNLFKDWEGR